jgi:hypothetical protein
MSYVNPIWLEGQRQRWTRHDAHRFAPPVPPKSFATRRLEQRQAEEEQAAIDAEWKSLYAEHLELRRQFAELKFELAWRRLCRKYGYNPNQPRRPRGDPEGPGRWVRVAGSSNSRGRGGGSFPDATPAQQARLAVAEARAQEAIRRVQQLDPNWRPSGSIRSGIEGAIREANDRAVEAQARFDQLRSAIGGNFGPALDRTSGPLAPLISRPDPSSLIDAYRSIHNMPDLFGQATWPDDKGTVAISRIDDATYFGINSHAPGYTDGDYNDAIAWRSTLNQKYPDAFSSAQIGLAPNDGLFHAEATVLMRAAKDNGGSLTNREINVSVDRNMCWSCETVMPLLGVELGNPTVTYTNLRDGTTRTMRDGAWSPKVRP